MNCYNCCHLKFDNKKGGKINGALYYCPKIKKYVYGNNEACEKYQYDNLRKTYIKDKIYLDGKNYCDDNTSLFSYVIILILILVIGFGIKLFGY